MHYDVAIIGTGAGGGTLLHALAPTGKRILVLERGDYVPREKANWSTRAVNLEGRYNTKEVWRDRDGQPLHPHTNYWVGGNTKFFGAALFRTVIHSNVKLKEASSYGLPIVDYDPEARGATDYMALAQEVVSEC